MTEHPFAHTSSGTIYTEILYSHSSLYFAYRSLAQILPVSKPNHGHGCWHAKGQPCGMHSMFGNSYRGTRGVADRTRGEHMWFTAYVRSTRLLRLHQFPFACTAMHNYELATRSQIRTVCSSFRCTQSSIDEPRPAMCSKPTRSRLGRYPVLKLASMRDTMGTFDWNISSDRHRDARKLSQRGIWDSLVHYAQTV